jgi:hypothetical protein
MFEFLGSRNRRVGEILSSWCPRSAARSVGLFALLLFSGLADAKTVYVNGAAKANGKGASWATAYKYLRDALDKTVPGDVIWLAKGTYLPDDGKSAIIGNREMSFDLKGQRIYGGFTGTETSLSQRNPTANPTILSGEIWGGASASDFRSLHVVVVEQDSTLDGVTVEKGHANGGHSWNYPRVSWYDHGGGCYVKSGKILTLERCVFKNNRALQHGGAIMIEDGTGKVIAGNCTFEGNEIRVFKQSFSDPGEISYEYNITTADVGGGAINGNVEATDCRFLNNFADASNFFKGSTSVAYGGAISGKVTALRCEFTGNSVFAYGSTVDVDTTSDGGAVAGDFTGVRCVFTGNRSHAYAAKGVSSGGALSGKVVNAFNCAFSSNQSGMGVFKEDEVTAGGGGAVYTTIGTSTLANCVFVGNTSEFRGGAVQGGITRETDSLFISNCTFLDNAESSGFQGAALSCGGIVRILNNIFWFVEDVLEEGEEPSEFRKDHLIHVIYDGAIRNSDERYPTPASAAPNIVKGALSAFSRGIAADLYLVSPSILIVDADPLFSALTDPDGADNRWGTVDDGLRLKPGSAAIGKALDPRVSGFVNVLPKDIVDCDQDDNLDERLPIDFAGYVRVQDRFAEIGAYEFGSMENVPEIAIFAGKKSLTDGATRDFGKVAIKKKSEQTFTIKSIGTNGLNDLSAVISGSKAFTIKKTKLEALDPGDEAEITIIFKPTNGGKSSAKLRIYSSDANESPFDITLTGKGLEKRSNRKTEDVGGKSGKSGGNENSGGTVTPDADGSVTPGFFTSEPAETVVTTTITMGGVKYLVLTAPKSAVRGGATVQVSSDLLDWYSGPAHTTILENSAAFLRVRDNTPVRSGQKRFIRLK